MQEKTGKINLQAESKIIRFGKAYGERSFNSRPYGGVLQRPLVLIFMGVSGSGKTTIARLFSEKTGATFIEGDEYHSVSNIAKMRQGIPLTDEDRRPWLKRLREIVVHSLAKSQLVAMTCSALKEKYRKQLKKGDPHVRFVHLAGPLDLIEKRMKERVHFLPVALLPSQFAALESPKNALVIDIRKSPEEIVDELIQLVGRYRSYGDFKTAPSSFEAVQ